MKKSLLCISVFFLIFGMYGGASAATITIYDYATLDDIDSYGGTSPNELEYFTDWVSWTHHFEFDPPMSQILSALFA